MSTLTRSPLPLTIRLTQALGLTTSTLLASTSLTTSFILVPLLLLSPAPLLLRQWHSNFRRHSFFGAPLAMLSASSQFYLFYLSQTAYLSSWLDGYGYLISGLLVLGIIPYTRIMMGETNGVLVGMAMKMEGLRGKGVEMRGGFSQSVHQLVDRWGVQGLGRVALSTVGALVGIWSVLN